MEGLAARALSEGGEVEMARSLWQRQLEEARDRYQGERQKPPAQHPGG